MVLPSSVVTGSWGLPWLSVAASQNGSPIPFYVLRPESVPNPVQTPRRTWIRSQSLLPLTCPGRTLTSLSMSVVVGPSELGLRESAFER